MKIADCMFQVLCITLFLAQVEASCAVSGQNLNGCCECAGDRKGTVHLNQIQCSRRDIAYNLIDSVNPLDWNGHNMDWTGMTFHCEANEFCNIGSITRHPNEIGISQVKRSLCRTAPEKTCYCTGVGNQIACNTNSNFGSCSGGGRNCELSPPVEIRWCAVNEVCYSRSNGGFPYGQWKKGCKKVTGRRRRVLVEKNPVCQYYPLDLTGTNDLWASPCSFWPESMCENNAELGVCAQCGTCTGVPKIESDLSLACESHPSTSSESSESVYATSSCSEWEEEMGQRMCGRDVMKVCPHCGHCNVGERRKLETRIQNSIYKLK